MTTEREDECDNYIATLDFSDLHELSVEKLIAMGWQARGRLDAKRIAELEDELIGWQGKSIEREQHLQIANSAVEAISLQNKVLREALIEADNDISDWVAYADEYFQNKHNLVGCVENYRTIALSTITNSDEWIRKDTLEMVATLKRETRTVFSPKKTEYPYTEVDYFIDENLLDGDYKLYRIKETTK